MERESFNFNFSHFCAVCFFNHVHGLFSVKIITFLNPEQNEGAKQHHTHTHTHIHTKLCNKEGGRAYKQNTPRWQRHWFYPLPERFG